MKYIIIVFCVLIIITAVVLLIYSIAKMFKGGCRSCAGCSEKCGCKKKKSKYLQIKNCIFAKKKRTKE